MALSKTTQDHDEIRQWAEARGAVPAEVASTEKNGQTGILRFEFPNAKNANDSALQGISWEEFFEKFDANGLALIFQEQTAEGEQSNFNKLVYPENAKEVSGKGDSGSKTSSKKVTTGAAAKKTSARKTSTKKATGTGSGTRSAAAGGAKSPSKGATKNAGRGGSKTAAKSSSKPAPAKKAAKSPAKKAPAKKAGAKKSAAKKSAAKKSSSSRSRRA